MAARAPHGSNQPPKIIVKKIYIEAHGAHQASAEGQGREQGKERDEDELGRPRYGPRGESKALRSNRNVLARRLHAVKRCSPARTGDIAAIAAMARRPSTIPCTTGRRR